MAGMKRERIWLSAAMRRSGQHAIMNQLCYQLDNVVHLNNCGINRQLGCIYPLKGRFRCYDNGAVSDYGPQPLWSYATEVRGFDHYRNLFCSFEDRPISLSYPDWVRKHDNVTMICIVRDPFNWLASSLKRGRGMVNNLPQRIATWKSHVTQCLNPEACEGGELIDINYNRWILEQGYRRETCERLGVEFSDSHFEDVVEIGHGSSFDGVEFDGRAGEMKVLDRWQQFADRDDFLSLLEDQELIRLSESYFDFNPFRERQITQ